MKSNGDNIIMNRELIIYGAGGAGRELAFSLSLETNKNNKWQLLGFVDDDQSLWNKKINGLPVMGGIEWLGGYGGNVAITTVGDPKIKRRIVNQLKKNNIIFPRIVGPNSVISSFVEWGEGCIVALSFNWISPNVKLGDFVFINCSTRIGHDVSIGDFTTIFSDIDVSGGAKIGSNCVIGTGVTINPMVEIGDGVIIGAGSVVSKDIPPNVVAAGVPARVIREIVK